jgi:hypothetical protein
VFSGFSGFVVGIVVLLVCDLWFVALLKPLLHSSHGNTNSDGVWWWGRAFWGLLFFVEWREGGLVFWFGGWEGGRGRTKRGKGGLFAGIEVVLNDEIELPGLLDLAWWRSLGEGRCKKIILG